MIYTTYNFRVKDSGTKTRLLRYSSAVNFVWNYCNEMSQKRFGQCGKPLSRFDLNKLTAGCSKELKLHSKSIAAVCDYFDRAQKRARKIKLKWRSGNRSLAYVPFKENCIKLIENGKLLYDKKVYRFWQTREVNGIVKQGSFYQNAQGKWFVSFIVEFEPMKNCVEAVESIGVDLGLKCTATYSDGKIFDGSKTLVRYSDKLAKAQRAKKKKQVSSIYCKIKNTRNDALQKETTRVVKSFDRVFVGNVSSQKLIKTRFAKSVLDVSWGLYRSMLEYKAKRLGKEVVTVNENYSTVTCSNCLQKTGPSGLSALGVREWACGCGSVNDRDVNAARNILRMGLHTLKEESSKKERKPMEATKVNIEEIRDIIKEQ